MGNSLYTHTEILNNSPYPIHVTVSSVDNYDWEGDNRPDMNLHDRTIEPYQSIRGTEVINIYARGNYYNLNFTREDGTQATLRIDQGNLQSRCFSFHADSGSSNYSLYVKYDNEARTVCVENNYIIGSMPENVHLRKSMGFLDTRTVIRNQNKRLIHVQVWDVDANNWCGDCRPDNNLHNRQIDPGDTISELEIIKADAKCNSYYLSITREDYSQATVRIDQKLLTEAESAVNTFVFSGSVHYITTVMYDTERSTVTVTDKCRVLATSQQSDGSAPPRRLTVAGDIVDAAFKFMGWNQRMIDEAIGTFSNVTFPSPWNISEIKPEFHLCLGSNQQKAQIISYDATPAKMYECLDKLAKTDRIIFIAHGFLNTGDAPWITKMKDAILSVENATVIVVDWGGGANIGFHRYPQAASNTQAVGEWVGSFAKVIRMRRRDKVQIWGIGHSLGAHLMGKAGRDSNSFDRITGLDPAGPAFEQCNQDKRLSKDVAKIVDIIHTDGLYTYPWAGVNHYGTLIPLGTTDFYPNWGMHQPGTFHYNLSHARAVELFVWSISNKGAFKTRQTVMKTPSFENISYEYKPCLQTAEMGFYFDQGVQPIPGRCYYIETGDREPWNEIRPVFHDKRDKDEL